VIQHVDQKRIPIERIDDAVRRILRVKFKFGMFTKPRPSQRKLTLNSDYLGSPKHREIAREAVRKSLVLLKNDNDLLPLNKQSRFIVAGKNAHNRGRQCGGFTIAWQGVQDNDSILGGTSIWEGIRAMAPHADLSKDGLGTEADPEKHDVGIVVIGERPYAEMLGDIRVAGLSKEKVPNLVSQDEMGHWGHDIGLTDKMAYAEMPIMDKGPYGTHLYLHELHPEDLVALHNIKMKGIPVVVILITGRPLVVNKELEASQAFVVAWLPGSEGQGVADVIFGDYDFQGKLSFSWPRYDDENWNIGDDNYSPLFPFGYGLRYRKEESTKEHPAKGSESVGPQYIQSKSYKQNLKND
jgi:beta-glucosidase